MQKIALIIAAAGIASFSGFAMAQTTPTFAQADTNQDGFVDFGEAQVAFPGLTQNNFDQIDANKDGKLTAAEFAELGPSLTNTNSNATGTQGSSSKSGG